MKIVSSVLLFLFAILSIASAEVIDVNIKGVDDGKKTNKQQDYQEAVMNAKLQAIERAGASIESITQVVNFQLQYDAVESKSKAVLLPGFQIIDIGYLSDGTYQVVLIGKLQVGDKGTQPKEIDRDFPFTAYDNRTVLDTESGLMWAAKDNGGDINWENAKSYCENYRGGGYTDWRMPTQKELVGLYDANKSRPAACDRSYNVHVKTELINITCGAAWTSDTRTDRLIPGSNATIFIPGSNAIFIAFGSYKLPDFVPDNRDKSHHGGLRALPVRNAK